MFAYYLGLAWHSLRRNHLLTSLMIVAIGLGIGASMTMLTVLRIMTNDPLPGRSADLYRPYLNPLPLHYPYSPGAGSPANALTWHDAKALFDADQGVRKAAMAQGYLVAQPSRAAARQKEVLGTFTNRDFFTMFAVPFIAGGPWPRQDDTDRAQVVVVTRELARRLFGSARLAPGKMARLGAHDFEVVGVVKDWNPQPAFYALNPGFGAGDRFFMPLSTAMSLHLGVTDMVNWASAGDASMHSATTGWLNFWVQLDTPRQVAAYRRFLFNYSALQKTLGVYQRPASDAKLYSLMQWLHRERVIPGNVMLQTWLALGFLFVCMLNVTALLLAKFLRRSGEISVRRALGARRRDIFAQFGIESALIGLGGGLLGIGLAELGLWSVRQRPSSYAHLAHMDGQMLLATVALAIVVSVVAGLLPAWRACRVPPAWYLKTL